MSVTGEVANKVEFGTGFKYEGKTLLDMENLLYKMRDDFEHHKKKHFPFFYDMPTFVHGPRVFKDEDGNDIAPYSIYAWHIEVPKNHVINLENADA